MKKILLFVIAFAVIGLSARGQNSLLYGMTKIGGINNLGTLFYYNNYTHGITTVFSFDSTNGSNPFGGLIMASNGKLYGMTQAGGSSNYGTLFEFNIANNTLTSIISFDSINGTNPMGSLMQASNGLLYGMTISGGSSNFGTLFQFNPSNNNLTTLINFANSNGKYPYGNLIQASNGLLYGMTYQGGSNGLGTIFQFNTSTNILTTIYNLNISSGAYPYGSLMQASNGLLYGMTGTGGSGSDGTIFKFNTTNNSFTRILNFSGLNGNNPRGNLMEATNGFLYGLTYNGGSNNGPGTLFKFDTSNYSINTIISFGVNSNGQYPCGSLIQASNGKIYGMTNLGGNLFKGTLFEFNPNTNGCVIEINFNNTNGEGPSYSSLLELPDSLIYHCAANFSLYPDTNILHHYLITDNSTGSGTLSYSWNWGDGHYDSIHYPSHIYADSGFYNICLTITDSLGCTSTSCDSSFHILRTKNTVYWVDVINPNFTTGILNNKTNPISIYPNPATNLLTITLPATTTKSSILNLYDMMGEKVLETNSTKSTQSTIDLSNLSQGIYFLEVMMDGEKVVRKVVKIN